MSEEEIIDKVMMIDQWKISGDIYTQGELNAIGELIDLYNKEKLNSLSLSEQLNKEKEKNKKIEDKIKRKIEWYQQYCDLGDQTIRALEDILE